MSQRALLPRGIDPRDVSNITIPTRTEAKRDPSPGSSLVTRKRGPLVSAACNSCRKRKVKCDGNKPHCSNCFKRSIPCIYDKTLKAERLKLIQERVKEALNELGHMKHFMSILAENTTNDENSAVLAQAIGNLEHLKSTFEDIEAEIPWRVPQSGAQSTSGTFPAEEDDEDEESVPPTPWSTQPPRPNFPMQSNASILFPNIEQQISMSSSSLGTSSQALPLSTGISGLLHIRLEGDNTSRYAYLHDMLPMISYTFDERSNSCILHQLNCRELLARGVAPENVLGPAALDLAWLFINGPMPSVSAFTAFVLSYLNTYPKWSGASWAFKAASAWSTFKIFRWLVYPTLTNYEAVPEFMRPTPAQFFTPHAFWIALVIRPDLRNEFVLRPSDDHWQQWVYMHSNARINWPSNDIYSIVVLDPETNKCHLTPEFESTINRLENWLFPEQ